MKNSTFFEKPEKILSLMLLFYLFILSFQVKKEGETVFSRVILTTLSPVISFIDNTYTVFQKGFNAYLWQRDMVLKSEELFKENLKLKGELLLKETLNEENKNLKKILNFKNEFPYEVIIAKCIVNYNNPFSRTLLLSVNNPDIHLEKLPVIDSSGVIGKIEGFYENKVKVTILTDPSSAIGVSSSRNGVSGVAFGNGKRVTVKYITNEADVKEGDLFVTSGEDGIFPKNLPVGKVVKVEDGGDYLKKIELEPVADLKKFDYVLIIKK